MTLRLTKSNRKDGFILNVGLNSTSKAKVLSFVRDSVRRGYKFYIVTPNPEIIMATQDDPEFLSILNRSDISLPDGVGISFAARFLGLKTEMRLIKGREMFMELVKLANKKHWKIFLLGGRPEAAQLTGEILSRSLKGVQIEFARGPLLNSAGEPQTLNDGEVEKNTLDKINHFAPQILFVGFGAPKQEKWIAKWLPKLNVGGAMVVGGTFDYLSGKVALPPGWMENAGLEWLWRLMRQPRRLKRVLTAVFVFPLRVLQSKLDRSR